MGPFSYGGAGSRFGAGRPGHTHQGQDLSAPAGTPIVAPHGGTIPTVAYQAGGAGHYIVLRSDGENRDYVFMHLATGSTRVRVGDRVSTGQRLGDVGQHRQLERPPPALRGVGGRLVHGRQARSTRCRC